MTIKKTRSKIGANWSSPIEGSPSFILWHKLKRLQVVLYKLNKPLLSANQRIIQAREQLAIAQESLLMDKWNPDKITNVKRCSEELLKWHDIEESVLKQRSKIKWIRDGDGNNAYFHASVRMEQSSKAISMLETADGQILSNPVDIEAEILGFYGDLMGHKANSLDCVDIGVLRHGSQINRDQKISLESGITEDEILAALKGIDDNSALGLDGYTAKIFKTSWNTIKPDVIAAIHEYFDKGKMYKAFNCSLVSLIPKSPSAKSIREFRPISVCSTFYKIISRILTNRLSKVIGSIVSTNQAAFIPGQQIQNHILLAFELLKGYEWKQGPPKCMFQVDLQKAYDMIDWQALECIMAELGIPLKFLKWIMQNLTSVSYRFNINGSHSKMLVARRGIRDAGEQRKKQDIFGVVTQEMKNNLLALSGFQEGTMPFKYLGVPITTKKLSIHHYMVLIDKIVCRTRIWTSKLLTYAGRLQLVKSISFAIVNYWMMCFPLPKVVLAKIDSICRSFLWTGKDHISRKSLVAWTTVCQPVNKGGLRVINIHIWNKCTLLKLLWNICNKPDNLWVKWIHAYYLKQQPIMTFTPNSASTWIIREIMNTRSLIQSCQSQWEGMILKNKFCCGEIYSSFNTNPSMDWSNLCIRNPARPCAIMILWLLCHKRLATKSRLCKFGFINNTNCLVCGLIESDSHIFFDCNEYHEIWRAILHWIQIDRCPKLWDEEISWLMTRTKGKGWRSRLLKLALAEDLYGIWIHRNSLIFGSPRDRKHTIQGIINKIVFRGWACRVLKPHIASLMTI
ncbi:uncharacterized protein LOC131598656 [Vicia villosa]|uniref:uncharacterized protein LOC131598656 n=1 Tax=Vicia villosa TaxID=3911 RepID=UPI00273C1055|nr:uncharacterized protein LOC131598656 [Vicia villosa]